MLDTNVLSELMAPAPDQRVIAWADAHPSEHLFTTALSEAEILFGIACLPAGRHRSDLRERASFLFDRLFSGRILRFGREEAAAYADIAARRRRSGRRLPPVDGLIAASALTAGAAVATRDVSDFASCGLTLIDPWTGAITPP